MKKVSIMIMLGFFGMIFVSTAAYPWGTITHTLIAHHLKTKAGPVNLDEIYGATAPDIFNYLSGLPYGDFLHDETHDHFMKFWNAVKWGWEKPSGYGFVCHNDVWGADSTAHWQALTTGESEGYVITKANLLKSNLDPLFDSLSIPEAIRLSLCHELVEVGVDILIKRNVDPLLGEKLYYATNRPSNVFQNLLTKAYALDFYNAYPGFTGSPESAADLLIDFDEQFRVSMQYYGQAFMMDAPDDLAAVSVVLSNLAYLVYGITVDPGIVSGALEVAMSICSGDYLDEILATIEHVDKEMKQHHILRKFH